VDVAVVLIINSALNWIVPVEAFIVLYVEITLNSKFHDAITQTGVVKAITEAVDPYLTLIVNCHDPAAVC
jgi:hypothetical protein